MSKVDVGLRSVAHDSSQLKTSDQNHIHDLCFNFCWPHGRPSRKPFSLKLHAVACSRQGFSDTRTN